MDDSGAAIVTGSTKARIAAGAAGGEVPAEQARVQDQEANDEHRPRSEPGIPGTERAEDDEDCAEPGRVPGRR